MKCETEFHATLQAHSWPKTENIARTTMTCGRPRSTALALFLGFRVVNPDLPCSELPVSRLKQMWRRERLPILDLRAVIGETQRNSYHFVQADIDGCFLMDACWRCGALIESLLP